MSLEELLETPEVQAVAIETEPRHLLQNAEICIKANKHIHLDKPAGESLVHFRKILDLAARQHLCVQMGYMYRYNPAIVFMKDLLRKGFLGQPFEVHCVMSKVLDDTSRSKLAEYPGGMMFELGCHLIDIVVDLLGRPESVTPFRQHAGPQSDRLFDNMLAVLTYPQCIATVKSTALEIDGFSRRHILICGTEGTIHVEPLDSPQKVRLTLSQDHGKYHQGEQTIMVLPYERYTADAIDFAKVIRGEKPLEWSILHDLDVQETVLRASGCSIDQ